MTSQPQLGLFSSAWFCEGDLFLFFFPRLLPVSLAGFRGQEKQQHRPNHCPVLCAMELAFSAPAVLSCRLPGGTRWALSLAVLGGQPRSSRAATSASNPSGPSRSRHTALQASQDCFWTFLAFVATDGFSGWGSSWPLLGPSERDFTGG